MSARETVEVHATSKATPGGTVARVENEVAPVCDGVVLHPHTPKEERITLAEARRRGIKVDDPVLQAAIDRA